MADVGGIAGKRLRAFIERIERLNEEKAALAADVREVFSEAKSTGFDVKIMRKILALRKMDKSDRDEQDHLLELYRRALDMDEPPLPLPDPEPAAAKRGPQGPIGDKPARKSKKPPAAEDRPSA